MSTNTIFSIWHEHAKQAQKSIVCVRAYREYRERQLSKFAELLNGSNQLSAIMPITLGNGSTYEVRVESRHLQAISAGTPTVLLPSEGKTIEVATSTLESQLEDIIAAQNVELAFLDSCLDAKESVVDFDRFYAFIQARAGQVAPRFIAPFRNIISSCGNAILALKTYFCSKKSSLYNNSDQTVEVIDYDLYAGSVWSLLWAKVTDTFKAIGQAFNDIFKFVKGAIERLGDLLAQGVQFLIQMLLPNSLFSRYTLVGKGDYGILDFPMLHFRYGSLKQDDDGDLIDFHIDVSNTVRYPYHTEGMKYQYSCAGIQSGSAGPWSRWWVKKYIADFLKGRNPDGSTYYRPLEIVLPARSDVPCYDAIARWAVDQNEVVHFSLYAAGSKDTIIPVDSFMDINEATKVYTILENTYNNAIAQLSYYVGLARNESLTVTPWQQAVDCKFVKSISEAVHDMSMTLPSIFTWGLGIHSVSDEATDFTQFAIQPGTSQVDFNLLTYIQDFASRLMMVPVIMMGNPFGTDFDSMMDEERESVYNLLASFFNGTPIFGPSEGYEAITFGTQDNMTEYYLSWRPYLESSVTPVLYHIQNNEEVLDEIVSHVLSLAVTAATAYFTFKLSNSALLAVTGKQKIEARKGNLLKKLGSEEGLTDDEMQELRSINRTTRLRTLALKALGMFSPVEVIKDFIMPVATAVGAGSFGIVNEVIDDDDDQPSGKVYPVTIGGVLSAITGDSRYLSYETADA